MTANFDRAVQNLIDSITNRDLPAFKSHLTKNSTLYTIVQNGHAFTTPAELVDIHASWFEEQGWVWEGKVVHKAVGTDMAMAIIKYQYRVHEKDMPVESWLTYVFALEDGAWKIIHDQNTALDFNAFSKTMTKVS